MQAKRLKKERELQDRFGWKELEDLERRAQYAAEMEMKRERSEAVLREREVTLQRVCLTDRCTVYSLLLVGSVVGVWP